MANLFPTYEFRPLLTRFRTGEPVFRYAEGLWIPDDGAYDLAFVCGNICLMVGLPYQRNIIWKWLDGSWQANEQRHPRANPWHHMLRDGTSVWGGNWGRDSHPNTVAGSSGMSWAAGQHRCANGVHVEFNLRDKHIAAGLVRDRDTKHVLTFPDVPCCMYCGDDGHLARAFHCEAP